MRMNKIIIVSVLFFICLFMAQMAQADSLVVGGGTSGTGTVGPGTAGKIAGFTSATTIGDTSANFDASGNLQVGGVKVLKTTDVSTDNSTANNYIKKDASGNIVNDGSPNTANGLVVTAPSNTVDDASKTTTLSTAKVNSYGYMINNRGWDKVADSSPCVLTSVVMTVNSGLIFVENVTDAAHKVAARDGSGNMYYLDPSTNIVTGPFKNVYTSNGIPKRTWVIRTFPDPLSTTGGLAWLVSMPGIVGTVDSKFYGSN